MKKSPLNIFIAILLFLFSFVIFSALGMFPKAISVKVPGWMQNFNSGLLLTGYDVDDKVDYETENNVISAGTFDKLNLFDSANAFTSITVNNKNTKVAYKEKQTFERFNLNKNEYEKSTENKEIAVGYSIKSGNRYYTYAENEYIQVIFSQKMNAKIYNSTENYIRDDGSYNYGALASLLEKQSKSNINLNEFCALLTIYFNDTLLGWYPETHTAVFKLTDNNTVSFLKYNTETMENKTSGIYSKKTLMFCVSESQYLSYDANDQKIEVYDFENNKPIFALTGINANIMDFNYLVSEDEKLTFAFITDNGMLHVKRTDIKEPLLNTYTTEHIPADTSKRLFLTDDCVYMFSDDEMLWWTLEV